MRELLLLDDAACEVEELASVDPALLHGLGDLPASQREALLAHVVEEREYAEIAVCLGCSELVVRQRVSRVLRTLRRGLPPHAKEATP